jgi:hypothetical protein
MLHFAKTNFIAFQMQRIVHCGASKQTLGIGVLRLGFRYKETSKG